MRELKHNDCTVMCDDCAWNVEKIPFILRVNHLAFLYFVYPDTLIGVRTSKNMREYDRKSKHFPLVSILLILATFFFDNGLILSRENCC